MHGAVGMAVLDELQDRSLTSTRARWRTPQGRHRRDTAPYGRIGAVRQRGLFLGIEWVADRESRTPDTHGARAACEALKDRGFLTAPAGALHNQVKIRPPLVFDQAQADLFLEAFADVAADQREG